MLFKTYKPLLFFSTLSLVLMILGLFVFIPIFLNFLNTGLVPKLPSLVASLILLLSSFLSFVCGVILDTVVKGERQNAEIQMNILKLLLTYSNRLNGYPK